MTQDSKKRIELKGFFEFCRKRGVPVATLSVERQADLYREYLQSLGRTPGV